MTYGMEVVRIVNNSDLKKCGVRYRLVAEEDCFRLLINAQQFNALPEEHRLIATAEVSKVMRTVRAMGVNFYLGESHVPV
jgi:hypothetical protein